MSDRVHLRELARRLGHNAGYISRLRAKGIIVFGDDGKIDEKEAIAAIEAARERLLTPSTNSRFLAARTSREFYSAQLAGLDYEERVALLVDATAARDAQSELARQVRDRMLAIPDRLAAVIAVETDPTKIRGMLAHEIKLALSSAIAQP